MRGNQSTYFMSAGSRFGAACFACPDDDFAPHAGRQTARFRVADRFVPSVRERAESAGMIG
jgi:hypothetical protein